MSTYFRPRPPSVTPSSPVRPSTARSTVRAVTPSPPYSFPKALGQSLRHSDTPARPKSEGFAGVSHHDSNFHFDEARAAPKRQELELLAKNDLSIEAAGLSRTPVHAPVSRLRRGGVVSGGLSPVKARTRSRSPRTRLFSAPTELPSHHKAFAAEETCLRNEHEDKNDKNEQYGEGTNDESGEEEEECPDTPTPMTRSQQRSAYHPLSLPSPLSKLEQTDHRDLVQSPWRSSGEILKHCRHNSHIVARPQPPTAICRPDSPFPRVPASHSLQDPAKTTPPQGSHRRIPRKHVPLHGPGRHISISGQSNMSGGTATSKRSIFSTPGRDELERKMALVEVDEGPFSRVTTLTDLRESRINISGGKSSKRKSNICGLQLERCNVM